MTLSFYCKKVLHVYLVSKHTKRYLKGKKKFATTLYLQIITHILKVQHLRPLPLLKISVSGAAFVHHSQYFSEMLKYSTGFTLTRNLFEQYTTKRDDNTLDVYLGANVSSHSDLSSFILYVKKLSICNNQNLNSIIL